MKRGIYVRSWFSKNWRVIVAISAVVAVVAGVGVWVAVDRVTQAESAIDCSVREVETFAEAAPRALACGVDVEIVSERTPWQTSWSTADGLSRLDVTAMPERVLVDGEWVDLNPSIVSVGGGEAEASARGSGASSGIAGMSTSDLPDPDSMLEVAAPVFPIEFNPGGLAGRGEPLGRIEKDGHTFEIWFPVTLPEPQIDGSKVVYDLGQGVNLFVTVNVDTTGFIPVIELESPSSLTHLKELLGLESATADGGSLSIEFPTQASSGLSYRQGEDLVELVDDAGEVQFVATAPSMWDSAAGDSLPGENGELVAIDRSSWPAEGDVVLPIGLNIEGTSLVITPDLEMLSSSETTWPVYIDPPISGKSAAEWIAVRSGGYTNTLYKWGDISSTMPGQGTGRCDSLPSCNVIFSQRLSWEFSGLHIIQQMTSADIVSATFNVNGVHSANCTAQRTTLRHTGDISTTTLFGNQPWYGTDGHRDEAHSATCGNRGFRPFSATNIIRALADGTSTYVSMGLLVNESSITYWKRFRHDANLNIVYNRAPLTPTSLVVGVNSEFKPCHLTTSAGAPPALATTTPALQAFFDDPDSQAMRPTFEVTTAVQNGSAWTIGTTPVWSATITTNVASDSTGKLDVAASANLLSGSTYAFRVRATDVPADTTIEPARTSAWTSWCLFTVDVDNPNAPTVSPGRTGVEAVYERDATRGGAGLSGQFVVDRGASTDVTEIEFTLDGEVGGGDVDANGRFVISYPAFTTGSKLLSVTSIDRAGNRSISTEYVFTVGTPSEDAVWILDEGTGATAAQSMGSSDNPLTIAGATWAAGPHSLFQSREGDFSLRFDGVNDAAVSQQSVLDTTEPYVVSAHVLLESAHVGTGVAVAVSQDGVTESSFRLRYQESCPTTASVGCWEFRVTPADSSQQAVSVFSPVPVRVDEWTHLVAVFDPTSAPPATPKVELWVCDIGTPTSPAVGEPIGARASIPAGFTPMSSTGGLAIGRGFVNGLGTGWWQGQIDNVRVFTGELVDPSKIRRMCQGAEATDFSSGEIALDPTIATQGE